MNFDLHVLNTFVWENSRNSAISFARQSKINNQKEKKKKSAALLELFSHGERQVSDISTQNSSV